MQEDIEHRSVTLAIKGAKLTEQIQVGTMMTDTKIARINPKELHVARWLLVRRSIDKPDVLRAYVT